MPFFNRDLIRNIDSYVLEESADDVRNFILEIRKFLQKEDTTCLEELRELATDIINEQKITLVFHKAAEIDWIVLNIEGTTWADSLFYPNKGDVVGHVIVKDVGIFTVALEKCYL